MLRLAASLADQAHVSLGDAITIDEYAACPAARAPIAACTRRASRAMSMPFSSLRARNANSLISVPSMRIPAD